MNRVIQLYGKISAKGKPFISGMDRFNKIFADNPKKKFIIEVSILEPNNIQSHVWYIMKMIIPAFIKGHLDKGLILTPSEAMADIIEACPIFYKTEKERHSVFNFRSYQPECDLSAFELEVAIDWLHEYCLKNFNISIGNTKII